MTHDLFTSISLYFKLWQTSFVFHLCCDWVLFSLAVTQQYSFFFFSFFFSGDSTGLPRKDTEKASWLKHDSKCAPCWVTAVMSLALSHIHKHISGALIDKKGKCSAKPISSRQTLPALQNAPEYPLPVRLTIKHFVPVICHSVRVPAYQYVVKGRETKGKTSPITERSYHTVHRQPRLQGLLCGCKYFFFSLLFPSLSW